MDNIRVFLWLTLLGVAWLVYTAWVADYGGATTSPASAPPVTQTGAPDETSLPPLTQTTAAPSQNQAQAAQVTAPAAPTGELIRVRTDVLDVRIASQGGDLVRADLLQ